MPAGFMRMKPADPRIDTFAAEGWLARGGILIAGRGTAAGSSEPTPLL